MKKTCILLALPLTIQACLSRPIHAQRLERTGSNKATATNLEDRVRKQGLDNGSVIVWAAKGCDVCEGFLNSIALENGARPFIERAYGTFVAAQVSPLRAGDSLVVALAVSANQEGSVGDPTENVTIEVAGSDIVLHSLPYADLAASAQQKEKRLPPGNVAVKKGEYCTFRSSLPRLWEPSSESNAPSYSIAECSSTIRFRVVIGFLTRKFALDKVGGFLCLRRGGNKAA
jgi:hypothetical protein